MCLTFILSSVVPLHYPIRTCLLSTGEIEKLCVVILEDDAIYEEEEEFRLVLGTPKSNSIFGASIGEQKETLVRIKDEEDSEFLSVFVFKYRHLNKCCNIISGQYQRFKGCAKVQRKVQKGQPVIYSIPILIAKKPAMNNHYMTYPQGKFPLILVVGQWFML